MRDHGQMVPFDEAMATVRRTAAGITVGTETLPVARAVGRICAEDQVSRLDMPPFDKAAMDGYAIPDAEPTTSYRRGPSPTGRWGRGRPSRS